MEITTLAKMFYVVDIIFIIGLLYGAEAYVLFKMKPKKLGVFLLYCFIPFAGIRKGFMTILMWEGGRFFTYFGLYAVIGKFGDGSLHPSEVLPSNLLFIISFLALQLATGGAYAPDSAKYGG